MRILQDGYIFLGEAGFSGPQVQPSKIVRFARDLGADLIIADERYTHTMRGAIPIATPTTETTVANVSGRVYGPGGYSSFSATGTSTSYGTATTFVPYSVDRYEHSFVFYRKYNKPSRIGLHLRLPTDEETRRAGTNRLAAILAVVRGTPAFEADLLNGDLLIKIGEIEISDGANWHRAGEQYRGQEVDFLILRGSERMTKRVRVGM